MLAQSHRHYEIVKMLQNETKVMRVKIFHRCKIFQLYQLLEKITMVPGII